MRYPKPPPPDVDEGIILALAIDGLSLGDDDLRAVASSLIGLVRYYERKQACHHCKR
jgi:hypothetical protein